MSNTKVLLVGPYPPPFGGLSVQLCQWQRYLSTRTGFKCEVLNIGEARDATIDGCIPTFGYWDFLKKLWDYSSQGYLIHLMTNGHNAKSWLSACACAIAGIRKRRTVLVFGSGNAPDYMESSNILVKFLIRMSLRLGGILICRNQEMYEALIRFGAVPSKTNIVTGFLGVNNSLNSKLPEAIQTFLSHHEPVLGATANLDPEYGIPLMLEAVEELSTKYPRVGLLVIGPDEKAKDEFTPCKRLDHVHFTGPLRNEVVRDVMNHLTIFLRPTYFDGDSLSVREALAQGLPVIASDTGFRPPGALLFTKGRTDELIARIIYVLDNIQHVRAGIVRKGESDSAAALLNIYQSLADNKS